MKKTNDLTLNFIGVYTNRFDKSLRFYTEVIGLGIRHSKHGWAAFATGQPKLELFETDKHLTKIKVNQEPVFIGFETQNIEDSLERIKSKNIDVVEELANHSWGIDFYINDPDGNLIQIAQYKRP